MRLNATRREAPCGLSRPIAPLGARCFMQLEVVTEELKDKPHSPYRD